MKNNKIKTLQISFLVLGFLGLIACQQKTETQSDFQYQDESYQDASYQAGSYDDPYLSEEAAYPPEDIVATPNPYEEELLQVQVPVDETQGMNMQGSAYATSPSPTDDPALARIPKAHIYPCAAGRGDQSPCPYAQKNKASVKMATAPVETYPVASKPIVPETAVHKDCACAGMVATSTANTTNTGCACAASTNCTCNQAPQQVTTNSGCPCQQHTQPSDCPRATGPIARYNAAQQRNRQMASGKDIQIAEQTSASSLNIETPARCQIPLKTNEIVTHIPLDGNMFKMSRLDPTDKLPRFEVNGYTFSNLPLDNAIQNLVSEAGIRVYSDDGLFPEVSGDNVRGELSAVIEQLAEAGEAFIRYDSTQKRLYLSRYARFELQIPGGRVGMYAVLDALRGAGITNVQTDYGLNTLYLRLSKESQETVLNLIQYFKDDSQLLLFDMRLYRLTQKPRAPQLDWQNLINRYGITRINMSVNGLAGRLLITDHQRKHSSFIDALMRYDNVNLVAEGVAVMPNGWKVRFDLGQCSNQNIMERDLSILLQSHIRTNMRLESNIALDTVNGELTSFHSFYNIDDTLSIIGIPGTVFNEGWKGVEYMMTVKPRLLKLVK